MATLLICSDIHHAGPAEQLRVNYESRGIRNPAVRLLIGLYRRHFWLRDPFAHNHLLGRMLRECPEPDLAVANGDFSCDTEAVGLSDPASLESATLALDSLRARFGSKFRPVFGDHELGKKSLGAGRGGPRIASLDICRDRLRIPTCWSETHGCWTLLAVTSTLAALPVFESECLPGELARWRAAREEHLKEIRREFIALPKGQRLLLFCHDPTALPFLAAIPELAARLGQIERTIIGHLHSNIILRQSQLMAGIPVMPGLGPSMTRMLRALNRAKAWKPFKVLLCPALAGLQITRSGGYFMAEIDPSGVKPLALRWHPLPWDRKT